MKKALMIWINLLFLLTVVTAQHDLSPAVADLSSKIDKTKKEIAGLEKELASARTAGLPATEKIEANITAKKKELFILESSYKALANVKTGPSVNAPSKTRSGNITTMPQRDESRIKTIPNTILSDAELTSYLPRVQNAVAAIMDTRIKQISQTVYNDVNRKFSDPAITGNAASVLWIAGAHLPAIYVLGKACLDDPENPDNLNNYAAFLIMAGAEHVALPILRTLNKRYPDDPTILNNIGQAWFGLGAPENATRFLDTATRLFPAHAQANYTLCLILESKGEKEAARERIKKSIQQGYSSEKEAKLKQLGGKLEFEDINLYLPKPRAPFGMHDYAIPDFPMTVDQQAQKEEDWKFFRSSVREALDREKNKEKRLKETINNQNQQRSSAGIGQSGEEITVLKSPVYKKALLKYVLFVEDKTGIIMSKKKELMLRQKETGLRIAELKKSRDSALTGIDRNYTSRIGEGRDNPLAQICAEKKAVVNNYLTKSNTLLHDLLFLELEFRKWFQQEDMFYKMYTMLNDTQWEYEQVKERISTLSYLYNLGGYEKYKLTCKDDNENITARPKNIPDYDDINCMYHTQLSLPWPVDDYFNIKVDCNRMTTKLNFDLKVFDFSLNYAENLNTGETINGTLEIGKTIGKKKLDMGPAKTDYEVSGGGFIEFDNNGISDIGVKATAKVKQTTNFDPHINASGNPVEPYNPSQTAFGVEAKLGWNSGCSMKGKGILKGIGVGK